MEINEKFLELTFYKNLQYKNTLIILFFTYSFTVIIAFLTHQLNPRSFLDMGLVAVLSSAFFIVFILFFNEFNYHIERILEIFYKRSLPKI